MPYELAPRHPVVGGDIEYGALFEALVVGAAMHADSLSEPMPK